MIYFVVKGVLFRDFVEPFCGAMSAHAVYSLLANDNLQEIYKLNLLLQHVEEPLEACTGTGLSKSVVSILAQRQETNKRNV